MKPKNPPFAPFLAAGSSHPVSSPDEGLDRKPSWLIGIDNDPTGEKAWKLAVANNEARERKRRRI